MFASFFESLSDYYVEIACLVIVIHFAWSLFDWIVSSIKEIISDIKSRRHPKD